MRPSLPLVLERTTLTERELRAGCHVCWGGKARWTTANAQALAAKHHDRTGHQTWCQISTQIFYGRSEADDRQIDLEDAIASASSGRAPECAPLTDLDAPAASPVGVSAPKGRSSKPALTAAKPETVTP